MLAQGQRLQHSGKARLDLVFACGLTLGAVLALSQSAFWPRPLLWAGLLAGLGSLLRWPRLRLLAGLGIGFAWAMLAAFWGMQARLPPALEGSEQVLEGRVLGLPERRGDALRFAFRVLHAEGEAQPLQGRTLRLSWYRAGPLPAPGSHWRLRLQLRRPRATLNPGGLDFERHALQRGIVALGQVRDGPDTRQVRPGGGVDGVRLHLSQAIAAALEAPASRFVQALAVGDTRALDGNDWQVLRATGISHLIAISGLHVSMVAGFAALLLRLLYRCLPQAGLRLPLPQAAALAALSLAGAYTALAGFALPTVRTLLMIGAALLATLLRRRFDPVQSFALALIAVLGFDPLAVLDAGFWLSFIGVAWLLWCLPPRRSLPGWRLLLDAQGVMTLGLLPLTVWFFGQASLAGPLCNLLAVPWVSFVVVPLALLGTALELLMPGWGAWSWRASGLAMQGLWQGLEKVADWPGAMLWLPEPGAAALLLALLGAFWLLLPRAVPGKALALLLFAPLLWPRTSVPAPGALELSLLDVGQGLAVLLRSSRHAVLVDAGPAFPTGLDMGEAAVVPALHALGVRRLDLLLLSHADNDHAGGAHAVRRAFPVEEVRVSRSRPESGEKPCRAGQHWQMDGLHLRVLHPPRHFPYLGNESSCVLRVESAEGKGLVLLPGDIGVLIERRLVREQAGQLQAALLLMPHHGSRSSSSNAFIAAVAPQLALIGAGHRNRFGLPRADILARYHARGIATLATAEAGAIHVRIDAGGIAAVSSERQRRPRLWREPAARENPPSSRPL